MSGLRILAYSRDDLVTCFVEASNATSAVISKKLHLEYFTDYFDALSAKTIVVEEPYVDHDYLVDYAAYYVRCFQDYSRTTTRLHFFSEAFDEAAFRATLTETAPALTEATLQSSYLGFIVVKPLPQTIIGRTCLKTYPDDNGRRNFPILRTYSVNLYGHALQVESLAFQEQDTVVAACATSALWSCFQGTGKLFQHAIPSPVEITNSATQYLPENLRGGNTWRAFPNSGLTATQMAQAIKEVGLEPFVVGATSAYVLNSTLYAYLRCKIPLILVFKLDEIAEQSGGDLVGPSPRVSRGYHAVAVTGFSLGLASPMPQGTTGFLLKAAAIDKLYSHDDQIGPFSRMEHLTDANGEEFLGTSWRGKGRVFAVPDFLLLPLYHKVRIPYREIESAVRKVDNVLDEVRILIDANRVRVVWDIFLTTVGEFKSDVLKSKLYENREVVEDALTANLPKFLWRATATIGEDRQFELIFDATGIAQQCLLVHVIEVRQDLPNLLAGLAPFVLANPDVIGYQAAAIFQHFLPSNVAP